MHILSFNYGEIRQSSSKYFFYLGVSKSNNSFYLQGFDYVWAMINMEEVLGLLSTFKRTRPYFYQATLWYLKN